MSPRVAPCFLAMGSVVENLILTQEFSSNEVFERGRRRSESFVRRKTFSEELRLTKTLNPKSSFRPQRVLRELGETSDTTIDKNSIILKFLRLDTYLVFTTNFKSFETNGARRSHLEWLQRKFEIKQPVTSRVCSHFERKKKPRKLCSDCQMAKAVSNDLKFVVSSCSNWCFK